MSKTDLRDQGKFGYFFHKNKKIWLGTGARQKRGLCLTHTSTLLLAVREGLWSQRSIIDLPAKASKVLGLNVAIAYAE